MHEQGGGGEGVSVGKPKNKGGYRPKSQFFKPRHKRANVLGARALFCDTAAADPKPGRGLRNEDDPAARADSLGIRVLCGLVEF
jgi:hypothetical protein